MGVREKGDLFGVGLKVKRGSNRKGGKGNRGTFDVKKAYSMRMRGVSYPEIARILTPEGRGKELTSMAVRAAVNKLIGKDAAASISKMHTGKSMKEDIQTLLEMKHRAAVEAITDDKLSIASAKDLAMVTKLLHEQSRLEQNKSTSNIATTFATFVERSLGEDGL